MRKMFACAALLSALSVLPAASDDGWLSYSVNPSYPPYHWASGAARFDGASVELLSLVLSPDVETRAVREPWKRALAMAAAGEIDLILSLRRTPEREAYLDFTEHRAFPNPIAVFARADAAFPVDDWAALVPLTGGVSLGDTFGGGFDEFLRARLAVETAPSMVENFRKLRLRRIDYFVTGYYMGMSYLAAEGLSAEIVALRPFVSDEGISFAFSKRSPWRRLLPAIDASLEALDRAGALEALLMKHLARFYSDSPPTLYVE